MEFSLIEGTEKEPDEIETPSYSDLFKDPIVPGEAPEITEQNTIVASMESMANSLNMLLQDIKNVGGMNKAMAMEAARIVPEFGSVPLNRYSEYPTATLYQVSLESLTNTLKNAIRKLIELIRKAINYLIFMITGQPGEKATPSIIEMYAQKQRQRAAWAQEAAQASENFYRYLFDSKIEIESLLQGDTIAKYSLNDVVDEALMDTRHYARAHALLKSGNRLIQDLADGGEQAQYIVNLGEVLRYSAEDLQDRATLLLKAFETRGSPADFINMVSKVMQSRRFLGPKRVGQYFIEDLPELIRTVENRMPQAEGVVDFDKLVETINRIYKTTNLDKLADDLGSTLGIMVKLRGTMEDIEDFSAQFTNEDVGNAKVNEEALKAISLLQREVLAVNNALNYLTKQKDMIDGIAYDAFRLAFKVKQAVTTKLQEVRAKQADIHRATHRSAEELDRLREKFGYSKEKMLMYQLGFMK